MNEPQVPQVVGATRRSRNDMIECRRKTGFELRIWLIDLRKAMSADRATTVLLG
jgi:hypothetical protein